jgi:glucuronate isomerase
MPHRPYIHDDFMLRTEEARRLYQEFAADMPIIDYHCHLDPALIADDHSFADMAEIWLKGDHYKWRAMRTNGVAERFCTGDASPWEKFEQWAAAMPYLLGNPLYAWSHLELARYFDITELLSPATARPIWERCNELLARPEFSVRSLMKRMNVRVVCTTDDPTSDLAHHRAIAADADFDIQVLPTWRPDKALAIDDPKSFNAWVDQLAAAADVDITDYDSFWQALRKQQNAFAEAGCRLSDHGLTELITDDYSDVEADRAFDSARSGKHLTPDAACAYKAAVLHELMAMNHEMGWTQQVHIGALRNTNARMFEALGPDTGFDAIHDAPVAEPLQRLLDGLERENSLTRTILYNLNPKDNPVIVTIMGSFQDGSIPGKMQFGSGWWFLDQKDGMERQMEDLSQLGLLSRFVGMLTDSRSFLSYPRHEFFRRVLCNKLGDQMDVGTLPADLDLVGRMVRDICYNNAARYFGFEGIEPLG